MLKEICTDLETSKKLKELWFDCETWFVWAEIENKWQLLFNTIELPADHYHKAFTLEQILEKLPKSIKSGRLIYDLNFDYIEECIEYKWGGDEPYIENKILLYEMQDIKQSQNWATIAAKLYIQLKESEIV